MDAYERGVRDLVDRLSRPVPTPRKALNALATSFVLDDDDAGAAAVFGQMVRLFPAGRFAERAAWKAGWWAYRQGAMADAVQFFETGAAELPALRLPAVVALLERPREGTARRRRRRRRPATRWPRPTTRTATTAAWRCAGWAGRRWRRRSPGARRCGRRRRRRSRRSRCCCRSASTTWRWPRRSSRGGMWGDSPALVATAALAQHRAGRLRLGINAMKRAYPQYLAAGRRVAAARGAARAVPARLLAAARGRRRQARPRQVPRRRAGGAGVDLRRRDPLVGRRDRTDADHARHRPRLRAADGHPPVQHRPAHRPGGQRRHRHAVPGRSGRSSSAARPTRWPPTTPASTAWCAGESERPGLPEDEWVDDIPFPETQNYVKRILGTAEDYRRLYGGGVLAPLATSGGGGHAAGTPPAAAPAKAKPRRQGAAGQEEAPHLSARARRGSSTTR